MMAQLFKHNEWKIFVEKFQEMNFKSCKDFLHEKCVCGKTEHSSVGLQKYNSSHRENFVPREHCMFTVRLTRLSEKHVDNHKLKTR